MPNTEEEDILLNVLLPGYFYQFSQYKIHQHSGDEIKFALKTRVNVCEQKNVKLNMLDFNESSCCTFDIQSGKPDRSSESILYKVCCGNKIPKTDFRN